MIQTPLRMAGQEWPVEVTLTNRETMLFRMLLGRTAMSRRLLVDPGRSFCLGTQLSHAYDLPEESS